MPTYYEILEVESTATGREITQSFRKLALIWHPDKNPNNIQEAEEKFKLIGEAYEALRDPERRRQYDAYLENQHQTTQLPQHHNAAAEMNVPNRAEEETPRWQRREASRGDVEALLRLATELLNAYLKEQERKCALGKQLVTAVRDEHYDGLGELISRGASLNELSEEGLTCLHYAIQRKNVPLACFMLDAGANVNKRAENGKTILHYAVEQDSLPLCKALVLRYHAETYAQDRQFEGTPLHYAINLRSSLEIQAFLIKHGSTYNGWFAQQYRAIDYQDINKDTPLHLAIKTKQFETVMLLVNKGARIDLKNRDGNTAADLMYQIRRELPTNISAWLDLQLAIKERQHNESCSIQ